MDKIEKALNKLSNKERESTKIILNQLFARRFHNLHIKKLKGRNDIYRLRRGRIRIIYRVDDKDIIYILSIERRPDTTYNF